jgi:transposase
MKRANYLSKLRGFYKSHGKENIVYFDESGSDKHSYRPHGWTLKGQKVYGDISGNNRKDCNLIMAQCRKKWLAPVIFKGSCCSKLVNAWLKDFLLKELKKPSVIVMDNAAFHKKSEIKMILQKAGHTLLPLPPYSPDLNPIEQSFAIIKNRRTYQNQSLEILLRVDY